MKRNPAFPAVGQTYLAEFNDSPMGAFAAEVSFTDDTVSFQAVAGDMKGAVDSMPYTAIEVAPGIYIVVWKENKTGVYVTHVENFNDGEVAASAMMPDGTPALMNGTWTRVKKG